MQEAHTSDTLDTDFLSVQPQASKIEQQLSGVYSIGDDQQMLQYLMQRVTIDKPLSLYRLLEQLQNQRTKVLCKRGQVVNSNSTIQKKVQEQETQQYIGVWNDWGKKSKNGNTIQKNSVKNIYQQHNYEGMIVKQLSSLYIGEDDNQSKKASEDDETCGNLLQHCQGGQVKNSLINNSDNNCYYQQYNQKKALQSATNNQCSSQQVVSNTELSIVSHSLHSVQSLLNKLSLFRQHSKLIRQKIKSSKLNIHNLYSLKQSKKQYLSHLVNIQTIVQTKLLTLGRVARNGDMEEGVQQEQQVLRRIEEMIMKYQYSPYVFLKRALEDRLFVIVSRRITASKVVRLMNLSGKVLLHLLQQFIPKLLSTCDPLPNKLTLTTLSRNLLKLIIYLKPDSYQCIDTKSSCYLNSRYQDLLQQQFVTLSLTKLTAYISIEEFIKVGSVMQFSVVSQRIYSVLRYVWLSLYQVGLQCVYSIFCPLLIDKSGKDNSSSSSINSNDKTKKLTRLFCNSMGISSDRLHQHYGRIGHTLLAITEMLEEFQPKYNWCYRLVVGRNVARLRGNGVVEYGQQYEKRSGNINDRNNTQSIVSMYLIYTLFKQVSQYHMRTVSIIESNLMFDYVFGNNIITNIQSKSSANNNQQLLLSVVKQIILQKQQRQIGKSSSKSNSKNKKKNTQKKQQSRRLFKNKQLLYTTPKRASKSIQKRDNSSMSSQKQQQQYSSPQATCSVQFKVMQRVQLQKMLVFDSDMLRTIQQQHKVEKVQLEIVSLLQRIGQLGQISQHINSINPMNDMMDKKVKQQQQSTSLKTTSISNIINKLIIEQQSEFIDSNNTNSAIQEMDEVKQFQAVLLKLIIQNTNESKSFNDVFSQMDKTVKCREMRISVLNSILIANDNSRDSYNSNSNIAVIQEMVQEIEQLQSLILNCYQNNKYRNNSNNCHSCDRLQQNMLQQRILKIIDLVVLEAEEIIKIKNHSQNSPRSIDAIVPNYHFHHQQQSLLLMSSLIIKLFIMMQILSFTWNKPNSNKDNSSSNKKAKSNHKNGSVTKIQSTTQFSTSSIPQKQQISKANIKKSFFGSVIAKITKQKKKPEHPEKQQNNVKSNICQLNHQQQQGGRQVDNNTKSSNQQHFQSKKVFLLSMLDVLRQQ